VLELILRQHKIHVQGGKDAYEKLVRSISDKAKELAERRPDLVTAGQSQRHPDCPICLDMFEQGSMYVTEYCGHVYCCSCSEALVENAVKNNDIPTRCCADGCNEPLAVHDLRNLLSGSLERIYDTAVRAFMLTNGDRYGSCVTPDCKMVYRRAPPGADGKDFHCSECGVTLCTACDTASHPGLTCGVLRRYGRDGEAVVRWVAEDPLNRCACPRCGVVIEKSDGCMHMECTACRRHFCWRCKAHFDTVAECYRHLGAVHGTYV